MGFNPRGPLQLEADSENHDAAENAAADSSDKAADSNKADASDKANAHHVAAWQCQSVLPCSGTAGVENGLQYLIYQLC